MSSGNNIKRVPVSDILREVVNINIVYTLLGGTHMMWFVKMLLELPRATLLYRREYRQVKFIRKVRLQHNKVDAYFIIIDKFKELYDDIDFFVITIG